MKFETDFALPAALPFFLVDMTLHFRLHCRDVSSGSPYARIYFAHFSAAAMAAGWADVRSRLRGGDGMIRSPVVEYARHASATPVLLAGAPICLLLQARDKAFIAPSWLATRSCVR